MPDLRNRSQYEQEASYAVATVLARQRMRYAAYTPERMESVPESEWKRNEEEIAAALLIVLAAPWWQGYSTLSASTGIVAQPRVAGERFRTWAEPFARRTAEQIVTTTRKIETSAAGVLVTPERLEQERRRAASIGVTNTTAAASAGEYAAGEEFEMETGRLLRAYWTTERDGKVCPICKPLDGKSATVFEVDFPSGPPAHVNCRCYLEWRVV